MHGEFQEEFQEAFPGNGPEPMSETPNATAEKGPHAAVEEEYTTPTPRLWWQGNWSPLWAMGTTYLLLFIVYLGMAEFGHKPAAFIVHTLLALSFVVACAANLFHTPSHAGCWRTVHRWIGWTAMFSGLAVVLTGYYMVFRRGYSTGISTTAETVFVVTGAFQLVVQGAMVYAMRLHQSTWYHMVCASILFYGAALMPALNRLPQILHLADSDAFTFAIMPLGAVFVCFSIYYHAKKMHNTSQ